jgi:para-nitrobenzyl esterase
LRFGWNIWAWARLQAETGTAPTFAYYFSHNPPFPENTPYSGWGASHFAELWYVFDKLDDEPWDWREPDRDVADTITSYWVNFARSGDPNGPGLPDWPRFSDGSSPVFHLREQPVVGELPNLDELRVFDTIYSGLRN